MKKKKKIKNKEVRALAQRALDSGWRIDPNPSGHQKWYAPDGETIVVVSNSTSDHKMIPNLRSLLRKAGLDL